MQRNTKIRVPVVLPPSKNLPEYVEVKFHPCSIHTMQELANKIFDNKKAVPGECGDLAW